MNFDIQSLYGNYKNDQVISMILLKYQEYKITIHVFHDRGSFLWIGVPFFPIVNINWFNDVPRAIQK